MLKRIALFICDLIAIGSAAVCAFLIRENFETSFEELMAFAPYVATTVLTGAASLIVSRLHRGVWRLSTLSDYLRICGLSVFIVVLSLAFGFLGNRLQNISRALPVIQIVFTVLGLVGLRVTARLLFAWSHKNIAHATARPDYARDTRTVILVGLNRLTMLYVRSVEDLANSKVRVAGIITDQASNHGRSLGKYPILGRSTDIEAIVANLAVHGVFVTHVCIMMSREELGSAAFDELSAAAAAHDLEIEFFLDKLMGVPVGAFAQEPLRSERVISNSHARANEQFWQYAHRRYWKVKRALDVIEERDRRRLAPGRVDDERLARTEHHQPVGGKRSHVGEGVP